MQLLNAVNRILPKLGEHPITSLSSKSPTLAILLPLIDEVIKRLTVQGWWFNTSVQVLYPDSLGAILVAPGIISFVADDYVTSTRGGKLHNSTDNTYVWAGSVTGTAIWFVPFEELPESVAQWVFYTALVEAFITDIGVTNEAQAWQAEVGPAEGRVLSEHLRNKRYTTQKSRRYARIRRAMRA